MEPLAVAMGNDTNLVPEEGVTWYSSSRNETMTTPAWMSPNESLVNETVEEEQLPIFLEYTLSLQIQAYAGILIVGLGLVGNSLSIAVLSQGTMVSSTTIYLINLAASDLGVIVIGQLCRVFPRALTGFDTGSYHPWICKWWFFVNHTATTISGWTLIAVTIERTLVVYMPFKAKTICTKPKAKIAICVINVLCAACYLHYFWSYGAVYKTEGGTEVLVAGCSILRTNPDLIPYMLNVRPWQDFIVRSAGPFGILLICNVLIIGKLLVEQRKRKKMSAQSSGQGGDASLASMTAMLLTISFAHLICISPLQIMYLFDKSDPFGWKMRERWQAVVALRWAFAIDVYYTNHAINFILYCISGREFRRALTAMFVRSPLCRKCCANKGGKRHSETSTLSITTQDSTGGVSTVSKNVV